MGHYIKLFALVSFCCLTVAPNFSAQEVESVRFGEVSITQSTALRSKPGTPGQVVLAQVPAGARLRWVEGVSKNGFFRVMTPRGMQGWIPVGAAHIERQVPVLLGAAPPCAQTLTACPERGCSQGGSKHALFNQTKRRPPFGTTPVALTFADFLSIQEQANELVDQGLDLSATDRAKLTNLHVSHGAVREGSLVKLIGFIAQGLDPHANRGESVNCRRTEQASNDFHISLVERVGQDEFEGIVVEMIPQERPAKWTLARLRSLKQQGRLVMIAGAIFYDNAHVVNADRENPLQGQPRRFSLWEVHPITQFFFCVKASNNCNPNNASDWKALEAP
jgi:hypothetical protein